MKFLKNFLPLIILSIYFTKEAQLSIDKNIYNRIELTLESNEVQIQSESSKYIIIELIFSHPSNYETTFNQIKESDEIDKTKNQTDLITKSEIKLGKNIIILNNENNSNNIIISIFSNRKENNNYNEFAYIKYIFSDNDDEKYELKKNKITYRKDNDKYELTLPGIKLNNQEDLNNLQINLNIALFDKEIIESIYQNFYIYQLDKDNSYQKANKSQSSLLTSEEIIKEEFSRKIDLIINKEKNMILLINIELINKDNDEKNILHYEYTIFEKEKSTEQDEEVDVEKNRDKNKILLIIIMAAFVGIIFLTFIIIFSYLKCKEDGIEDSIEEEKDYSNIGGLTPSKTEDDTSKTAEE